MSTTSGAGPLGPLEAWLESHRELMRQERELADLATRVATGSAAQQDLDAANEAVMALRARSELLMHQYLSSRSRP